MIEFRDISKSFSGVTVLRKISFSQAPGQTLGLVGENGAGKSTLMNILGGNIRPDSGSMLLAGSGFAPSGPSSAASSGIAFIHQELNLFPNLSIAENIWLANFPCKNRLPLIDRRALNDKTNALLEQVGLKLPPTMLIERLTPGERQMVEIAKALSIDARLIIFDEPTTSLAAKECETLFTLIRRLRSRGISMIYISHTLEDVLNLSDQIVVLRDGEVAGSGPVVEFTPSRLVSLMVGRSLNRLYPEKNQNPPGEVVLEIRRLSQPGIVRDISFQLRSGEVLGLSGLMGAGRSELARILFGLDPYESGEIRLNGEQIIPGNPQNQVRRGLALVTENRREDGLCMDASIADNAALVSLRQYSRPPAKLLDLKKIRESFAAIRQAVRLNPTARDEQLARTLSGGNQQKVVLAKWLLAKPKVFILDEPTRGIDVGAKYEIYQLIHQLAAEGAGVLVISSELEELIGICDRILVMNRGEIRGEFAAPTFDREKILQAALHT